MLQFSDMLVAMTELLPIQVGSSETLLLLSVSQFEISVPLEASLRSDASFRASLPRGRLATGFDPPLGKLTARFEVLT